MTADGNIDRGVRFVIVATPGVVTASFRLLSLIASPRRCQARATPYHRAMDAAIPILCLHAALSSGAQWRPRARRLAPRFALASPDFLGDGATPAPAGFDWRGVLDADTAIALHALERHGRPVDVIGHSYGGVIAIRVARARPDAVRSLLLVEPVSFERLRVAPFALRATADGVLAACQAAVDRGQLDAAAEIFVRFWSGDPAWRDAPAAVRAVMARGMSKVVAGWAAIAREPWPGGDATRLAVPVHVVAGTDSPAVSVWMSEQWLAPGGALEHVAGAGHMSVVSHADAVAAIASRWIDSACAPRAVRRRAITG
jgi:lipase